jgi:hypothetical protein
MSDHDDEADAGPAQDLTSAETADAPDDPTESVTGPSGSVQRRGREISPRVRELFAKAAESVKAQKVTLDRDDTDLEDEDGDSVEVATPAAVAAAVVATPAPAPVEPAPAPVEPAPAPAPPVQVPVAPPAPSLDPRVSQLREQWASRNAELDAREQQIATREAQADEERVRDSYLEAHDVAVLDFVKKHSGVATDDELADEVADLIVKLSARVHKVEVDPVVQSRIDSKQTLRYVKAQKAALAKREESAQKQAQAAQQQAEVARAQTLLGKEITKPEVAKQYPFLSTLDNAGEIVWEVIDAEFKRSGETLTWTGAAQRADQYLKTKASTEHDRWKHLLEVPPAKPPAVEAPVASTPGDQSGIRRSRALTNAGTAAPATPTPPPKVDGKWDPDKHRAETRRKMKAAVDAAKAREAATE